jgi:hypothetical protein
VNKQKEAKIVNDLIKEAIDLQKWAQEIHDLSIKAGKIAIGEIKDPVIPPDLRSFGSCMAPITKVFDCMTRKSENTNRNETESDGLIDALKATAKNDWKDARPVSLETSEPETEDGNELVAP